MKRRKKKTSAPGTLSARMTALYDFCIAQGLCTGLEARPAELALIASYKWHRAENKRLRRRVRVAAILYNEISELHRDMCVVAWERYQEVKELEAKLNALLQSKAPAGIAAEGDDAGAQGAEQGTQATD